jgi:hypothetical protein
MVYVIFSEHTGWCSDPMTWDEVQATEYMGTGEQTASIRETDIPEFATSVYRHTVDESPIRWDLAKEIQ